MPFPLPESAAGFCSLYRPLCISNRGLGNAFAVVMPAVAASNDCLLANSSGLLITTVLINSLMVMICMVSALKGAARTSIMLRTAMDMYAVGFLLERSVELPIEFIVKLKTLCLKNFISVLFVRNLSGKRIMAGIRLSFRAVYFFLTIHFIPISSMGEKKPET
jgi:hypothetical protein